MQVRMTQIWISITYRSSVQDSRNWPTSTAITRARVKTTEANLGARIQQHLSFNSYPSEKRKIRGEIKKETRWPLDERIIFTLTERADTIIWFFFFVFYFFFLFFIYFFIFFWNLPLFLLSLFQFYLLFAQRLCWVRREAALKKKKKKKSIASGTEEVMEPASTRVQASTVIGFFF